MKKFFAPLVTFGGGMLTILVAFLFLPHVKEAGDELATDSATIRDTFWQGSMVFNGTNIMFLVMIALVLVVLVNVAIAFIRRSN